MSDKGMKDLKRENIFKSDKEIKLSNQTMNKSVKSDKGIKSIDQLNQLKTKKKQTVVVWINYKLGLNCINCQMSKKTQSPKCTGFQAAKLTILQEHLLGGFIASSPKEQLTH